MRLVHRRLMQALQEGKAMWNRTNAVGWLLNHQGPDGAFFDVTTTAEVIIALARVSGVAEGIADHCEVRPGAGKRDAPGEEGSRSPSPPIHLTSPPLHRPPVESSVPGGDQS